jgi:hypothetical protein
VLCYLAEQGHEITLASFVRPEEEQFVAELKRVCAQVYTVLIRRSRLNDVFYMVRSQLTGRPFLIERDDLSEMRSLVEGLLHGGGFDYALADQLTMTQFLIPKRSGKESQSITSRQPQRIFDAHNAVWTIVERMRQTTPWYLRPVLGLEAKRVKRYEANLVLDFEHTFAVTSIDKKDLLDAVSEAAPDSEQDISPKITVIPIAVDTARLAPVQRQQVRPISSRSARCITPPTLMASGGLPRKFSRALPAKYRRQPCRSWGRTRHPISLRWLKIIPAKLLLPVMSRN